jgi:hypothetical protein
MPMSVEALQLIDNPFGRQRDGDFVKGRRIVSAKSCTDAWINSEASGAGGSLMKDHIAGA